MGRWLFVLDFLILHCREPGVTFLGEVRRDNAERSQSITIPDSVLKISLFISII